jgi:hypothetical protein
MRTKMNKLAVFLVTLVILVVSYHALEFIEAYRQKRYTVCMKALENECL